ncbi:hypothetical protein NNC19_16190 [Clostridium sp. SHJSY1]|uniref:hypothetical protein n=1 Tax=Clostridium sp. SHJSY1 TaxID=2942483 RepID=UPI0028750E54|nr:hypothetical protein [Clostridium sp. SHJSY1]MDS0527231.1 hypothetical protein [Clostridium sp. SHJSY1]
MRELRIEEQKNICGGKVNYVFEDYTKNLLHESLSFDKLYKIREKLIAEGHSVSGIWEE